jgi:translation initiation factor 2 subunit 3
MTDEMTDDITQSVLNIGTLGHIDHGKTSLVKALTHQWTDRHSESLKRNMTIKLGYADMIIRKCSKCEGAAAYTVEDTCGKCGGKAEPLMRASILDAPGHETLMATAISEANIINAILFVIAANEACPMQQTREHLMIINLLGIQNVIIIQSKIDIVGKQKALENFRQIKNFIKGSSIENAPIIPVMTNHNINIDVLLEMIAKLPRPDPQLDAEPLMYIARSFDVNKPGMDASKIVGGIVGGTLTRGTFKVGDQIEIRPGINVGQGSKKEVYAPVITVIEGINNGTGKLESAKAGGLIGLSTEIDPAFTKADGLVGNIAGKPGKLPAAVSSLTIKYHKLKRDDIPERAFTVGEAIILSVGTATVVGYIKKAKRDNLEIELKRPVAAEKGTKMAIMKNLLQRWRLTGYGIYN